MLNKQIRIRVVGGLGNQLFVYFAGLYLSQISGRVLTLDLRDVSSEHSSFTLFSFNEPMRFQIRNRPRVHLISRLADSYRFRFPILAKLTDSLVGNYFDEGFQANVLRLNTRKRIVKLSGYFQDFRYIDNQEDNKLTLNSPEYSNSSFEGDNTLAIHIRRGDFINEKLTHGCLDTSWYYRAISYQLQTNPGIRQLRIFSNDTDWVSSNLSSICPSTETEIKIVQFDPQEDPAISFLEFAGCEYRVCSNSTFSLLASYLIPGKTVVPFPYNRSGNFKTLEESSPSSWVRIPSIWED